MAGYDESWDCPHQPDTRALWQESDWLTFYDVKAGVGATCRIGRQPNRGKGQPSLFCFAMGGQRFYLQDVGGRGLDCDITPEDIGKSGCRVAGHSVEARGNGHMIFAWDYPETEARLEFGESYYTPRGWSKATHGDDPMTWINPDGHLECAGRLTGTIRIGEQRYEVDCPAHRDRSWGYRENYMDKMRRLGGGWGSTGIGFSFATTMLDVRDGKRVVLGFISRDGNEEEVIDVRYLPMFDEDLASPIAGLIIMTLENGEVIRLHCEFAQAFGGYVPGTSFSALGTFAYQGAIGFCNFAASGNASAAASKPHPSELTLLTAQPGLSMTASPAFEGPFMLPKR